MTMPEQWECDLYSKVLTTLEEGKRTDSSYYVLVEESLRLCSKYFGSADDG